MPVHRCGSSALCLHELGGIEADEAGDFEYIEIDPTGRYGRYKEVLGRGAFKTVYRAFDQEDGIEVAWNQVQDVLLRTQEDLDRLYSEVHLLSQLKHKNIIKLYHSWVDKKAHTVNFITEIFTSGTLRQYRKRHKHIDIKAVKNWSRQILRGLLYLHSHDPPIIHRDLKCDNIFINGNQGEVKIGDLGLAAILQHAHARSVIGTPEFMAPELYEEEYTELVDVYSFGMCLLEMVTSEYPYSECSNAAQIYKKVMLGKRPEAMKLVKDPELCQFIEKCLAPASKRLPARELLMDPFLQCEGSQSALESSPHVGRIVRRASGMDELGVINEEPHAISATVQISYVLKETLPAFVHDGSDVCGCSAGDSKAAQNGDFKAQQSAELVPVHYKEDRARSVDFRVNGKRREDDNVFLKLRISGSEGQVRNIHFPFDVERDTAMCVASEMVAELDLTDQDVTKIAEMIDAAIMALVPEWKPGVAIDETCCEGEALDIEGGDVSANVFDPVALSEGLLEDIIPSSPITEMLSPSKIEGLVYGRFEEVTYQCHRSEFPAHEVEQCTEQCTVSSDTSDLSKEGDWSLSDSSSSHTSQMLLPTNEAVIPLFEQPSHIDSMEARDGSHAATAFNELVESKRKSGCANFVHKIWEGLVHGHSCGETNAMLASAPLQEGDDEDFDDEATRELAELALRHEQERLELQLKHEEALAEVRKRCRQRRSMRCEDSDDSCHNPGSKFLASSLEGLKTVDSSCEMQRNVPCEYGSLTGSMTSLEDFSSIGQETPRSMSKAGVWQEPKF
ncbi:hypothetical protein GOP47_0017822 [Adiantum capillus-veneris]|uniref:non-specific serine/threonine protein kinase n=1 Tax=Adiantum capillus-veneris TaxID=13818 RepID=A0A9D4UG50_ADICA|nr:hypothetical protein GOP47_0017822 [Adiantum capillus-veneris]